jgi:hypothetical protein
VAKGNNVAGNPQTQCAIAACSNAEALPRWGRTMTSATPHPFTQLGTIVRLIEDAYGHKAEEQGSIVGYSHSGSPLVRFSDGVLRVPGDRLLPRR